MKSFKAFILEEIKYHQDNPGGSWEERKQNIANDHYAERKGLHGATTGYFNKNLRLPVNDIKHLPGAMGEHKFRDSGKKQDRISSQIGHPKNFNSKEHPIMIGVNHRGEAHVMEGNHRLAYAAKHKISHIYSEVKYYNGGERINGPHSPKKMLSLHKPED